jgi:hypothetical protein
LELFYFRLVCAKVSITAIHIIPANEINDVNDENTAEIIVTITSWPYSWRRART